MSRSIYRTLLFFNVIVPIVLAQAVPAWANEPLLINLTVSDVHNNTPGPSTTFTLSWDVPWSVDGVDSRLMERRPDGSFHSAIDYLKYSPVTLSRATPGTWGYWVIFYEPGGGSAKGVSSEIQIDVPATDAPMRVDKDADGDILPDELEAAWGLNPNDPSDADQDPDGDRLTYRDEYFAGTDPVSYTTVSSMTDWQILDLFKGKAFFYFWEQSRPPYYFTADNSNYNGGPDFSDNFNSIATTGFALMSYVVADERGWVEHEAVYERIRTLLSRAVELQDPSHDLIGAPSNQQGNRHGYLYHFVDNQGFRIYGTEISTVDHALFLAGAVVAGEYYRGTEVEQFARQLVLNTDWNWLYDGTFLYQGWVEDPGGAFDGGRTLDRWDRYSELLILMFLAMGHPDGSKAIPASAWDALTYGQGKMFPFEYAHLSPGDAPQNFAFVPNMPNTIEEAGFTNSATELHYLHAGSLHNHQYSHLFADFRARRDRYGTDFFANSISATMANRQFCINLNSHAFPDGSGEAQPYDTYGPNSWGLMAGIPSYTGYAVLQPIVMWWDNFSPANISGNTDSGTVLGSAPLGSAPFTPRQTIDFTRNLLSRFQANESGYDALMGRYGFMNAFNLGRTHSGQFGHFAVKVIGLDMGPVVGSIENLQTGLIWKMAMRNDFIRQGMQDAGFPTGAVEPFILNFDDSPPEPHEDPNGGGEDPNSFGGFSLAFGSGTVTYVAIGDPFPSMNFGPQYWAQRISASDNTDSGAFILLKNHSVSNWDRLSFWIKGDVGGESYSVGLKDRVVDRMGNSLQAIEVKLPIADYHPSRAITSSWSEVRIPLRDFADQDVRLTGLDNISFTSTSPGGGVIEIDDIAFLGDEFAPSSPQGLSANTDNVSFVMLSWQANAEPDVVGYRIYRSDDDGNSFTLLNALLDVSTTFTDSTASPQDYLYRITAVDNAQPPNESAPSSSVLASINRSPVLDFIANQSVDEGDIVQFAVSASDPNISDTLSLSARLLNNDPLDTIGAFFADQGEGAGSFFWAPDAGRGALAGRPYDVVFTATDEGGLEASQTAVITVYDATFVNHLSGWVLTDEALRLGTVKVKLSGRTTAGRTLRLTVLSGADGAYDFANLPAGRYKIKVLLRGYRFGPRVMGEFVLPGETPPVVIAVPRNSFQEPPLAGAGRISGTVTGANGIIEVRLKGRAVSGRNIRLEVLADSEGQYVFESLPASGGYIITPKARGYRFQPRKQHIPLGEGEELSLEPFVKMGTVLFFGSGHKK